MMINWLVYRIETQFFDIKNILEQGFSTLLKNWSNVFIIAS